MTPLLFFAALQDALQGDRDLVDRWHGVMAIVVVDEPWYVRTTVDAGPPACVRGEYLRGPDVVVRVPNPVSWVEMTGDPATIPTLIAEGEITIDEGADLAFFSTHLRLLAIAAKGG